MNRRRAFLTTGLVAVVLVSCVFVLVRVFAHRASRPNIYDPQNIFDMPNIHTD